MSRSIDPNATEITSSSNDSSYEAPLRITETEMNLNLFWTLAITNVCVYKHHLNSFTQISGAYD